MDTVAKTRKMAIAKDLTNSVEEWPERFKGQLDQDKLMKAAWEAVDECLSRSYRSSKYFESVETALSQAQHKYDVYPSETGYNPNNQPEISQILATHSPTVSISLVEAYQLTLSCLIWAYASDYPQWLPELLSLALIRPDSVDDYTQRLKLDDEAYQDPYQILTKLKIAKLTLGPDGGFKTVEFNIGPLDPADCTKLEVRMSYLVSVFYWAYSKAKADKDKDPQGT